MCKCLNLKKQKTKQCLQLFHSKGLNGFFQLLKILDLLVETRGGKTAQ